MYIQLKTPYSPGMNDPGNTYPQIMITQMTDNRTAGNFQFIYEAGSFVSSVDPSGATIQVWSKGPGMLSQTAVVSGADYINAIAAQPLVSTDTAYQSIIRILYTKLIAQGFAGSIVGS